MKQLEIKGSTGHSSLLVGETMKNLSRYLPKTNTVIITDEKIEHLYKDQLPNFPIISIGQGEKIKTLETVQSIHRSLVQRDADRSTFILGVGGGIVLDITGFVASTFLRGVPFGFIATTLLAQVDASVGGKNGVNLDGYKNMIGVFNQPEFVICDMDVLKTLSDQDRRCGFAEIIKHGAIKDLDLIDYLEKHRDHALELSAKSVEYLVYQSVLIKSKVVSKDEKEKGERRKLNFGHTFGHAIEKTYGLPHGESVALGMVMASNLSSLKGMLRKDENERLKQLIKDYGLPVQFNYDIQKVIDAMIKDKKRVGNHIHFILLNGLGNAVVETLSIDYLLKVAPDLL